MQLAWKNKGFALRYQIILAISERTHELTIDEREAIKTIALSSAAKADCRIVSIELGSTWMSYVVDADPGVDPGKTVKTIKSETSYRLKERVAGRLWSNHHVILTIGDHIVPEIAANELRSRTRGKKENPK